MNKKNDQTDLKVLIDATVAQLAETSPFSDEYETLLKQLERLKALEEKRETLSPDAAAKAGAYVVGIAMIVWHERADVVGSKALSLIAKML